MNYHNIIHDDMRNGPGLRVTLFVSGCDHHCEGCHNPETWPQLSGIEFDEAAENELYEYLSRDYIDGITFSGGDPFNYANVDTVLRLVKSIKEKFPTKTIMVYTGYDLGYIVQQTRVFPDDENFQTMRKILGMIDMLVDGKYDETLADVNYKWAGSTNQSVILNLQEYLDFRYPGWIYRGEDK